VGPGANSSGGCGEFRPLRLAEERFEFEEYHEVLVELGDPSRLMTPSTNSGAAGTEVIGWMGRIS
jgi:hypothetical protein